PQETVVGSSTAPAPASSSQTQTRQAAEEARKDRTLAEFMLMLDEYEPLVRVSRMWSTRTFYNIAVCAITRYLMRLQTTTSNALGSNVRTSDCESILAAIIHVLTRTSPLGSGCS